jgi:cephalosporin hydroxylase
VSSSDDLLERFTDRYVHTLGTWANTFWLGQQVVKCPLDLWVYQEILWETQPDLILETGSCIGGSAYFFATVFDMMATDGRIVTVDKDPYFNQPEHPRITWLIGDAVAPDIVEEMLSHQAPKTMVVLDSLHTFDHVRAELEAYSPAVSGGCYLVVEDTTQPEARDAVDSFLEDHPLFEVDPSREKHLLTLNPGGWLRRREEY